MIHELKFDITIGKWKKKKKKMTLKKKKNSNDTIKYILIDLLNIIFVI